MWCSDYLLANQWRYLSRNIQRFIMTTHSLYVLQILSLCLDKGNHFWAFLTVLVKDHLTKVLKWGNPPFKKISPAYYFSKLIKIVIAQGWRTTENNGFLLVICVCSLSPPKHYKHTVGVKTVGISHFDCVYIIVAYTAFWWFLMCGIEQTFTLCSPSSAYFNHHGWPHQHLKMWAL